MTTQDDARRANQRRRGCKYCCQTCFGDVWLGSGYLPHAPDCERGDAQERAALARTGSPFPVRDLSLHPLADISESPWSTDEDYRRRALTRYLWRSGHRTEGITQKREAG